MPKQIVTTCTSDKKIYQLVLDITGNESDKGFDTISSLNHYCYIDDGSQQLKHLPMGTDSFIGMSSISEDSAINVINSSIDTISRKFNQLHVEKVDYLHGLMELLKEEVRNNADIIFQSLEKDFDDGEHPV